MGQIRILRIITRLNTGGPASYLVTLFKALDSSRYDQRLIAGREAPSEGSMWSFVESQGLQPILVPEMVGTSTLRLSDLKAMRRIRQLIGEIRPDIVETHTSKAGVLGRLAAALDGGPIVLHVYHGHVLSGYYGGAKTWMARYAERLCARATDHLVAVSARVKVDLVRYRVSTPERITVIEPGLDLAPLVDCRNVRGRLRRELGIATDVPLVGIVGRLSSIKNPGLFLAAAEITLARHPEARFLVVGEGELGPELRARAREGALNGRVIFTGWRHDLPDVYADLDVVVSTSNNEGMPLTIIEAMAAGCPVVATAVGGVPDLLDDGVTGLLVPPRDRALLAEAIGRLLENRPLAGAIASRASARALVRFTPGRFAAEMSGLYKRLLRRRHAASSSPARGAPPEPAGDPPGMTEEPDVRERRAGRDAVVRVEPPVGRGE